MTLGTWLFTLVNGELIGSDGMGNRYYRGRKTRAGQRERRWVVYNGAAEASSVPSEWHGWLHGRDGAVAPVDGVARKPWQAEHETNHTGTSSAYRPPGDVLRSGQRDRATGDYEPWRPN